VEQVRRVNKLAGMETKVTTFTFNGSCCGNIDGSGNGKKGKN
jgi:hypothetical protein